MRSVLMSFPSTSVGRIAMADAPGLPKSLSSGDGGPPRRPEGEEDDPNRQIRGIGYSVRKHYVHANRSNVFPNRLQN